MGWLLWAIFAVHFGTPNSQGDWGGSVDDVRVAYERNDWQTCLDAVATASKRVPAKQLPFLAVYGARCSSALNKRKAFEHWVVEAGSTLSQDERERLEKAIVRNEADDHPNYAHRAPPVHPAGTVPPEMVRVPAGEFWMGCSEADDTECSLDEKPGHLVFLDEFWIDRYEVTVSEYEQCVKARKCTVPSTIGHYGACTWAADGKKEHPINCIDWAQARAYCSWARKRLPTEAEWEKAARGIDRRKYSWGHAAYGATVAYANIADEAVRGRREGLVVVAGYNDGAFLTAPKGKYPLGKSPFGALDMIGNVSEWVADWWSDGGYLDRAAIKNPRGPEQGLLRVVRGAAWSSGRRNARVAQRFAVDPIERFDDVGVRCAW